MKRFLKELMITILLCIALVLILAVIFYDYIPINKTIPQSIEYSMPESMSEVKEELNNAVQNEESRIIVTYEIDDSVKFPLIKYTPSSVCSIELIVSSESTKIK